jgi:hypothetical protein
MLIPTPLKAGESYATVAEIRDSPDLPRMPVTPSFQRADGGIEPLWTRPDGSALTILVRAPSFSERREINSASGDSDDDFTLETCFYCIAEPAFTREQLKEVLATKHPAALDQISETAWKLADLPAAMVDREVRRLAGLPAKARKPKTGPRKRTVAE